MVALAWVIALPVCYAHSWGDSNGLVSILENWFGKSQSPSLYVTAVLVYMIPDAVSALLFLFPMLRRAIERSELTIVKLLLWWAQVNSVLHVFKASDYLVKLYVAIRNRH
jgi:callose synthase